MAKKASFKQIAGELTAAKRNKIPSNKFGLPGERKYPQQVKAGNLSPSSAARIKAKANRVLGK